MGNLFMFGSVASWLMGVLHTICLFIDGIVYYFVALTYKVFYVVSKANLFGDAELKQVTDRVYIVLGVFMLFVFAYNILMLIAYPDNLGGKDDKSLGSLAKNMIISIVILTLLPTIFNYLHKIQNSVLESNVIGNMILGGWSDANTDYSISEAGTNTALTILGAFYHPIVNGEDVSATDCAQMIANGEQGPKDICTQYLGSYIQAQELMKFRAFTLNDVLIEGIYDGSMEYLPIISTIAGYFAAYLFMSFSIDVGVRIAKLAFLQLIAPVPVVFRITKPKGGTFDRWMKEMTTTFFSVFIRLAFIFFVMYIISLIPTVLSNLWQHGDDSVGGFVRLLATVIVILGVLSFAKSGPKMVEDLFAIEHLNINIKKKLEENEYAMRAATAVGSGISTAAGNIYKGVKDDNMSGGQTALSGIGGLFGGARRGWKNGNVDKLENLKGAVDKSKTEADVKRGERDEFWGGFMRDPNNPNSVDPAAYIRDRFEDKKKSATEWLGSGSSDAQLKASKELAASMDRLNNGLEALGGAIVKQMKSAKDAALKDYYQGKPVNLMDRDTGKPMVFYDDRGNVRTMNADDIKKYYAKQLNSELAAQTKKQVGKEIVERSSADILKQLQKSLAVMGKDARNQIVKDAEFGSLEDLEGAIKDFASNAKSGNATDADLALFGKISGAISDQVTAQNSRAQLEQAKDKK